MGLLPARHTPRLSLPIQATPHRLPSLPLLTLPSSITMLELIQSVLLPLRPTWTPSSQAPLKQWPVRLLLWPTWMLLRLILYLIRTLPVAELLMLTLPSTTNKYYILHYSCYTCLLVIKFCCCTKCYLLRFYMT